MLGGIAGLAEAGRRSSGGAALRRVARGATSSATPIDPAAGLVVRDGLGVHRVCGAALPLMVEALDEALAGTRPAPAPIDSEEPDVALSLVGSPLRREAAMWKTSVEAGDVVAEVRKSGAARNQTPTPTPPRKPTPLSGW